jgi:UDP-N-acetylglucosamine--N-acetylmuramyl-(pentapeptide) pyrophosphoryl-undecaprenol N-acetylglucosamine transferase
MSGPGSLRIVLAGGGTGGHLYPGLAVAKALHRRVPDAVLTFVGTARGLESSVVPSEGFPLDVIRSGGLKGKSPKALLRGMALLPWSAVDAWRVISRRAPALVIGLGGYSSGPVVLLAALRGIPTLLLEQNAVPGLTNRLLGRVVRRAAVSFEQTASYFGAKAIVSGNPVRAEFFERAGRARAGATGVPPAAPRVLVFGGSQGAHAINAAMAAAAPSLAVGTVRPVVTHQTGPRDVSMVREAYERAGLEARVEPFLYAMDREMSEADVLVCRAGATTLAEIAAAARAAILIPLPTATDDHQRRNAEVLAAAGAAELLEERALSGDDLAARILSLAQDPERRDRMAHAVRQFARPRAAEVIVECALDLATGSGRREGPMASRSQ